MRIKLDYDDFRIFSTVTHPTAGPYRTLVVKVNGKAFSAWRTVAPIEIYMYRGEDYMREIDNMLVASMEQMLTKVFVDACAAVPEGTELLTNG